MARACGHAVTALRAAISLTGRPEGSKETAPAFAAIVGIVHAGLGMRGSARVNWDGTRPWSKSRAIEWAPAQLTRSSDARLDQPAVALPKRG